MSIKLEDCTPISNLEYMDLIDPKFEAQTRVDENGDYYMVFSSQGVYYSTFNNIRS